jgi:hypothetical protein
VAVGRVELLDDRRGVRRRASAGSPQAARAPIAVSSVPPAKTIEARLFIALRRRWLRATRSSFGNIEVSAVLVVLVIVVSSLARTYLQRTCHRSVRVTI